MATRTDLELEFMDNATGAKPYRTHPQGANRDFTGLGIGIRKGEGIDAPEAVGGNKKPRRNQIGGVFRDVSTATSKVCKP